MAAKMLALRVSSKVVGTGYKVFSLKAFPILGFKRAVWASDCVSHDLRHRTFYTIAPLRVAYFYRVTFETGDRFGGGTDANIYIKLIGERGITDEIRVPSKKGDLERGMTNSFEITADDVGPLKRVFVRHDNSGIAPAWFLEKITIENHTGEDFVFRCNDWLRVSGARGKLGLVKSVLEEKVKKALGKEAAARVEEDTTFDEYTSMTEDKVHKKLSNVLSEVLGDEDHDEKENEPVKIEKQTERKAKPGRGTSEPKIPVTEGAAVGSAVGTSPQTRKLTHVAKPKKAEKARDTSAFNRVKEEETPVTLQSQRRSKKLVSTQSAQVDPPLLPAVRLLIDTHGLQRELIRPTGPKGRILKGDVLSYLKGNSKVPDAMMLAAQDKPFPQLKPTVDKAGAAGTEASLLPVGFEADFQDIPNSNVRKTIASRLTAAKTSIPHAYAGLTCNISKVVDLRRQLKKDGVLLTLNDFVVKAVAMALRNVPDMNSQWTGEAAAVVQNVDVSIAVATDKGLITPIVRDADQLEMTALSKAVQGLAKKAREGKLTPQEYQGGTFTVSNLGMFGLDHFSAIINPPQTCIMAVGGTKLSLCEDGTVNSHVTVTLSYDGRALDETVAFNFLQQFKVYLENPFGYLIS